MKKCIIVFMLSLVLCPALLVEAQSDQSLHVKEFAGVTVGEKVANAMSTCPKQGPCILILDASLATAAAGTMPQLCSRCSLLDYRNGVRTSLTGGPGVSNYPFFQTGPMVQTASESRFVLDTPLGIGVNSAEGFAGSLIDPTILRGGAYSTQQMNQYSDYFASMLSRSQGSHQLNAFYAAGLGTGDMIDHSGNLFCAGGSGNLIGGIARPACQFSQPAIYTWPYVFEGHLISAPTAGTMSYIPTLHEDVAAGARTLWDLSRIYATGTATYTTTSIPGIVTFSGNADFTAMTPTPIGQLLVLGSSGQGYTPTAGECSGDDVVIDGLCWGHPQRVNAILGPHQLQVENNYDQRLTAANTASVPYALIPAVPLTDIDTQTHTATALGRLLTATVVSAGSSITPGTYLLNGSGGLGAGLQCSTPPTAPTSGNLQCAQIQVVVGATGTVTSVTPTVSGGPVYVSAPSFTMVSSSPALGGGVANCGATCPTFRAYLDTAPLAAFHAGDTIAQPPDHRMAWNSTQAIYYPIYRDLIGGAVEKNMGPSRLYGAFTAQGDSGSGVGGWRYAFVDSAAQLDYWSNFAGQALKYGMFYGPSSTFGSSIWDYNGVTAQMGTDFSGATFASKAMTGASQPSQQPALFLSQQHSICAGNYGAACAVALSFRPTTSTEPLHALVGDNPVPISSGLQGYYSFAVTDHVNSALTWVHSAGVVQNQVAIVSGAATYTSVVDSLSVSGGAIVRSSTPLTNFLSGIKLASGQALTSTDGVGSQVVTIAPGGKIPITEVTAGVTADCIAGHMAKPCMVASSAPVDVSVTGTGAINTAFTYTPSANGVYRLCGTLIIKSASSGGTVYINPTYTTQTVSQTSDTIGGSISASTANAHTASNTCATIESDALPVVYRLVANGVTGTAVVRYSGTMEWLQ